jgi:glycosyltransferase involved in cell wall biosynthesis
VTANEPRQGHSHARNAAVKLARGELLLWTDDDVLVPADWAEQYVLAAGRFPEAAAFGGPVRPWWEEPPPAWVARNLSWLGRCWALLDHGPDVRKLDVSGGEKIFGANMGFRTPVLRQYPYDPHLGRVGDRLTSADDTRVVEDMVRDGHPAVWVGTAPVDHHIGRERVSAAWVEGIHRWQAYLESRHMADGPGKLFGVPRWVWRWHLQSRLTELVRRPLKDDRWLKAVIDRGKSRGVIDFARQPRD